MILGKLVLRMLMEGESQVPALLEWRMPPSVPAPVKSMKGEVQLTSNLLPAGYLRLWCVLCWACSVFHPKLTVWRPSYSSLGTIKGAVRGWCLRLWSSHHRERNSRCGWKAFSPPHHHCGHSGSLCGAATQCVSLGLHGVGWSACWMWWCHHCAGVLKWTCCN